MHQKITNNLPLYRPEVDRIWSRNKLLAFGPLFLMVWSFCKAATASWALVAFLGSREDTSLNKPGKQWLITLTWKGFWKKFVKLVVRKLWKSYCSPVVEFLRQGSTKGQLISKRNFWILPILQKTNAILYNFGPTFGVWGESKISFWNLLAFL